jgi:diguanylate cyclase (GGDEF) domain
MDIKNVAAVVSGMDEEYPYQIILGINEFAKKNNINITYFAAFGGIIDSRDFDIGEFGVYKLPDFSKFDGAILLSNTFSNPKVRNSIIDKVRAAKIPTVIFECEDYEEFTSINTNNYSVMKQLVEHLIEVHGCKTFNFVAGPTTNSEACDRYRAFRDALSEAGIEFDEENRFYQGLFRNYDGIKAIEAFEKSGMSLPDAFVCANDSMALTAMSHLQHMGYKIPEDVIVTGFDNISNARSACPTLTTVKRPLFYSGMKACSTLFKLMNGEEQPKSIFVEAEPVYSESCGCKVDDLENYRDLKLNTYLRIDRTYENVHMLNRLIASLGVAENMEECIVSLEQMLKMIDCKSFSLCLVNNWEKSYDVASLEEDDSEYPPYMTAPFIWDNGERRSVKKFPSSQLWPEPLTTGGNISYFLPLHYSQRCLGYYIMTNNDFPIYSLLCHTMTMCIGTAVDNISKLNVLDPLCKIYNRNGFNKNANYVVKECIADKSPLTICFIDMDDLKVINDNYGHKEGDFAIKGVADAISSSCGSMDVYGRFGGDEFIVLGHEGGSFAEEFEKKLTRNLNELNETADKPYKVSVSIGHITAVPKKGDSLFDLIQQADADMYRVKHTKK